MFLSMKCDEYGRDSQINITKGIGIVAMIVGHTDLKICLCLDVCC